MLTRRSLFKSAFLGLALSGLKLGLSPKLKLEEESAYDEFTRFVDDSPQSPEVAWKFMMNHMTWTEEEIVLLS